MILARTFQDPDLHLMQLDTPRPEQALYKPKELLEALRESPLYDAERGQWNYYMNKGQVLQSSDRTAYNQLFGILVLAVFDSYGAKESYEKLKDTALYDKVSEQWNGFMSENQKIIDADRTALNQLLDILVLAEFNPNAAKEAYERLKTTQLYDKERKQWNRMMGADQQLQDSDRPAQAQLLAIVVESKLLKLFPPATQLTVESLPLPTVWRGR